MDVLIGLLGFAAVVWILVGPFLFFAHSTRISSLTDEIQRLRRELDKRVTAQSNRLSGLSEELHQLRDQERVRTAFTGAEPATGSPGEAGPAPAVETSVLPLKPAHTPDATSASPLTAAREATPPPVVAPAFALEATQSVAAEDPSVWLDDSQVELAGSQPLRDTAELRRERLERRSLPTVEQKPASRPAPVAKPASPFTEMDASQWMSWIGAIAVMIGMGYFLKYAIDEQWLGPIGRVALGILGGMTVFVGAAYGMKQDYRVLAEGLAGAAMGILYFSFFAAFQWYDLLPQLVAFAGMILVTAAGLSFAAKFNSLPSAILAMIGGFLTPFMLSKGGGNVSTLFTYILILDLGVLALATFRSWGSLHLLNFSGTLLIWLGWLANGYRPEELWLTVAWITLFAVVFSLMGLWRHVIRRETSSTPDMALMLLTPIAFFGALYGLTKAQYSDYHGLMALAVALYYIVLGVFAFLRNPGNNQIVVTLIGVGLSFVTLAVPLQLTGHWIVIAWAVESLLLIEIGLRYEKPGFRLTGFALLAVVQMHMVMYAGGTLTGPQEFTTGFVRRLWEDPVSVEAGKSAVSGIINGRSMSFLANAIVLAILAWEYRRREKTARIAGGDALPQFGLKGHFPDAGQVSMILIPLVPVMVLALGLLETFVYGVRAHWPLSTHLSMLPIWLSFFAVTTLLSFKRMNDVSTLGALAKCLYGVTGCLFLVFFLTQFPDWSSGRDPLWGRTLFNPRGVGFLSALGAVLIGAIQFSRSASEESENRSIGTSLTLAVPFVLLGMCLTETFAYGRRDGWLGATQLSFAGIWLAVFSIGTLIAARWLQNARKLEMLSRLFYIATAGLILILLGTTFGDAAVQGATISLEAWSRPLLNPRGMCLLIGAISIALGVMGQSTPVGLRDRVFAKVLVLAVPITLLAMCLIETYAYGRRDLWIWASHLSSVGIWLSLFAVGVLFAGRRWVSERVPLTVLSQLLTVGFCAVVSLLVLGTLADWGHAVLMTLSSAWNYPFLNPRGVCFLLAVWATLVGWKFSLRHEDSAPDPVRSRLPAFQGNQLALLAYVIAFLMCTIEVFALGKQHFWGTATSLAITGTWAVLAITTIAAGFARRSAPIRILALGVFALTTGKVFFYDVWYLDKPIRVAAFMGLGVALFVGSFLYRRFSGQMKDWIKPMSLLLAAMVTLGCGSPTSAQEPGPDLSTQFMHRFELGAYTQAIVGGEVDADFVRISLTPEMYAASQNDLLDLRLLSVDTQGVSTQIPYILLSPSDEFGPADQNLPLVDRQEVGDTTEFIVSAKEISEPVESLRLSVSSPEPEYVRSLRLYGANQMNDGDWKLLVNDGYLVDRTRGTLRRQESSIECPRSQFRYYRIVIENEGQAPLSIDGCTAHMVRRRAAPRLCYPVTVKNEVRTETQTTRVELSLAGPVPIDRLEFEAFGAEEYNRNAQLFAIHDTSTTPITSVQLFHLARVSKGHTVTATFSTERSQRLRLEIQNGDNQPLTITSAQAFGIERSLVVQIKSLTAAANPVALFIGGKVSAPDYDLSRISTLPAVETLATLSVFPGALNTNYHEVRLKRPWAEEHRTLVWVLVLGGVVVLSGIAVALLKAAGEQQPAVTEPTADADPRV